MAQILPWLQEIYQELRESNAQPVSEREYGLLVAMIAVAVLMGAIALISR